jgi:hypothetical protein
MAVTFVVTAARRSLLVMTFGMVASRCLLRVMTFGVVAVGYALAAIGPPLGAAVVAIGAVRVCSCSSRSRAEGSELSPGTIEASRWRRSSSRRGD